jgi:hypothetical protein
VKSVCQSSAEVLNLGYGDINIKVKTHKGTRIPRFLRTSLTTSCHSADYGIRHIVIGAINAQDEHFPREW